MLDTENKRRKEQLKQKVKKRYNVTIDPENYLFIPAFLTAFTKSQQLTADEIQEMQQMIDRFRKEHPDD